MLPLFSFVSFFHSGPPGRKGIPGVTVPLPQGPIERPYGNMGYPGENGSPGSMGEAGSTGMPGRPGKYSNILVY